MSTPSRFARWRIPILNERLGYTVSPEPDPDPEDPTDYALATEGGAVQIAISIGTVAKVQDDEGAIAGVVSSGCSATLASSPEEGHTLIALLSYRGTSTSHSDPGGWTKVADVEGPAFDGGRLILYYKVAGAAESSSLFIGCSAHAKQLYLAEWSGLGAFDLDTETDGQGATTTMVTNSVTPTTLGGVLFAGFNQSARNPTLAVQSPFTEDHDVDIDASGPSTAFGHRVVASFSGSYTATCTSSHSEGYGSFIAAFSAEDAVWTQGPAANDADDDTYAESDAEINDASLRIALAVERLIYRVELRIACENAGSKTYEVYGSDDALFTSPVLLATETFTSAGSFAEQEVVFSWLPTSTYQYYEIRGTTETRRYHDINMFSTTGIVGVSDHPALTGRDDAEQHPATAVSYDNATSLLTATDVQAAIDEIVASGGSISVTDGTTTVDPTTDIVFDGAEVTDDGGGQVTVTIESGGGGGISRTTVGTTTLGASFDTTMKTVYKRVTIPEPCLLASISVGYKSDASNAGYFLAGVMTDNAGTPNQLIGYSGAPSRSNAANTQLLAGAFPSTTARFIAQPMNLWIAAAGDYWLVVVGEANTGNAVQMAYSSGTGSDRTKASTDAIYDHANGASSAGTNDYSIYADLIVTRAGLGDGVGAKAYNSTTQNINGTTAALTFDSEEYDTHAFHDTSSNTARMTIPAGMGGKYQLSGGTFASSTANWIAFRLNGSTMLRGGDNFSSAGRRGVSTDVVLAAGDYVELLADSTGAGSINFGFAGTNPDAQSWFAIHRIDSGSTGDGSLPTTRARRTSGNLTLNSTSWANVDTGMDLTVAAQVGDWLEVSLSATTGSENVNVGLDGATLVSGSPVNYISGSAGGASAYGVQGWLGIAAVATATGSTVRYQVVSGDLSGGNVTLRLRYRTDSAANKTLNASTNQPLEWSVVNLRSRGIEPPTAVSETILGADVTMTNANQLYDGPTVTPSAGTYLVLGKIICTNNSSLTDSLATTIVYGSTIYDDAFTDVAAGVGTGAQYTHTMMAKITADGSTAIKLQAAGGRAGWTIKRDARTNGGSVHKSTKIELISCA